MSPIVKAIRRRKARLPMSIRPPNPTLTHRDSFQRNHHRSKLASTTKMPLIINSSRLLMNGEVNVQLRKMTMFSRRHQILLRRSLSERRKLILLARHRSRPRRYHRSAWVRSYRAGTATSFISSKILMRIWRSMTKKHFVLRLAMISTIRRIVKRVVYEGVAKCFLRLAGHT